MWKTIGKWALVALAAAGCWAAVQQARQAADIPVPIAMTASAQWPLFVVYGLATAVPVGVVALAVLFGAEAGTRLVGGVQRWQRPLQVANGWLVSGIGIYLTLSGSLGLL